MIMKNSTGWNLLKIETGSVKVCTNRAHQLVALVTVLVLCPVLMFSQVATGAPPFGSFTGGPDVINLANLNDHWTFPIFRKAGRGQSFTYGLKYDSSIWDPSSRTWQPVGGSNSTWGWQAQGSALMGYVT